MGKIIGTVIILIIIILANIKDFVYLLKGYTNEYIQSKSGMLYSLVALCWFILDIDKSQAIMTILIIYGIYITVYTIIFFEIKKYKEEREKEKDE